MRNIEMIVEALRMYNDAPVCELCYDDRWLADDEICTWSELPQFLPQHEADIAELVGALERIERVAKHPPADVIVANTAKKALAKHRGGCK